MALQDQHVMQIIDVAEWPREEQFNPYPEGSRAKELLRCPPEKPFDYLIPGHRYLFKESRNSYPDQFWAEIVAYRVGLALGVVVPPAYPAISSDTGISASLIEWFYGYPKRLPGEGQLIERMAEAISTARDIIAEHVIGRLLGPAQPVQKVSESSDRFVLGGNWMLRLIPNFDRKRGAQHNVGTIMKLVKIFESQGWWLKNSHEHWAKVFLFDALIGNTDRHQDNWGTIIRMDGPNLQMQFSPAFDNGTSLGHEILPANFHEFSSPERLEQYVQRGRHHVRWSIQDDRRCQHFELVHRFCSEYPETRKVVEECLRFDFSELEKTLLALTKIDAPTPFTTDRCDLILTLLKRRKHCLEQAI